MPTALKAVLFSLLVPGIVGGALPYVISQPAAFVRDGWAIAAAVMIAAGFGLYVASTTAFVRVGDGTPAPVDEPKKFVGSGVYRYSRNPMYVGMLLAIFGQALGFRVLRTGVYGLLVLVCFELFVRFYEEPHLRRKFGSEYEEYLGRVRRWV